MSGLDADTIEEAPALSSDTLGLLAEFYAERDAREKTFQDLQANAEDVFSRSRGKLSMELFSEDWNASQFWYSDETAQILARQLLHKATSDSKIAVVSAPSVYIQLRNILDEEYTDDSRPQLCLLEFDERFAVLGDDFVRYDFNQPLKLASDLKGKFDRIICDPPFLSEDCQTKTALTVRYLASSWARPVEDEGWQGLRFISCTGERMSDIIHRVYANIGARTTTFEPRHSKGLSNEFRCYANFECDDWKWSSEDECART